MTDSVHVRTKHAADFAQTRTLTVTTIENPTDSNIENYVTGVDPSVICSKNPEGYPAAQSLKITNIEKEIETSWLTAYVTGVNPADIYTKNIVTSGGVKHVYIGNNGLPDIGPVVYPSNDDHKNAVVDLAPVDLAIYEDVTFDLPSVIAGRASAAAEYILYPVSARHIVRDSTGLIHAVVCIKIGSRQRVVYLVSDSGGVAWSAEVVDSDEDYMEYIYPSITVDRFDGVHLVYSRWDGIEGRCFLLYAGSTTPTGWTLVSGSGGEFYNRLLCAWDFYCDGMADTHSHNFNWIDQLPGAVYAADMGPRYQARYDHHSDYTIAMSESSIIPPYKTLKVISYPGLPPSIPKDAVLMFSISAPSGFTRYSAQDGFYIRCSDTVGSTGGTTNHKHTISGELLDSHGGCCGDFQCAFDNIASACYHSHTFSFDTEYSDHLPLAWNVVLGKADSEMFTIPATAILMFDLFPTNSEFLSLSGAEESLQYMSIKGGTSYEEGGGSMIHDHGTYASGTSSTYSGHEGETTWSNFESPFAAAYPHNHRVDAALAGEYNFPSMKGVPLCRATSDLDCSTFGKDIFYRYRPKDGAWTDPLNISNSNSYYQQVEPAILADSNNDLHVVWGYGYWATPYAHTKIVYRKRTGASWGAIEDVSTDQANLRYPSIDIDRAGNVHVAWWDATNFNAVQYRKKSPSGWESVENIDTNSYVGWISNLVADANGYPHLVYAKFSSMENKYKELYYTKRTGAGWASPTNITPNKASSNYHQFPGQLSLDNKGGLFVSFSGMGYGSYPAKYSLACRYVKPDGTIVPSTSLPPEPLLEDEDVHCIYPCLFWHIYPYASGVYQNLTIQGLTMLYLHDLTGTYFETADVKFHSSEQAIVGDAADHGRGGSGSGRIVGDLGTIGGTGGESVLQKTSYHTTIRGSICQSKINPPRIFGRNIK